jgi:hypothetical protein
MTSHLLVALALAGCGSESTSFRSTDQVDSGRTPAPAVYEVRGTQVRVWSNGGYISNTDEPMTHVAFEITNPGPRPLELASEALQLSVFDRNGVALVAPFVALTPLGPAHVPVPKGTTTLDAYFRLPVRPRVVAHMDVRWAIRVDDALQTVTTSFVRDDDFPIAEPPTAPLGS